MDAEEVNSFWISMGLFH